ncbi:hypothetical protein [Burkholderia gladioli]|uniref:hypothetical protein n=1 Tax=Burkholderia gladioli TaxID=28095 RepID=UPI003D1A188C
MDSSTVPRPLTGAKLALGTVAVSLAMFMNVLDSSIANVAIRPSRANSASRSTRAPG